MTATLHFRRLIAEYWQPIYERQQLVMEAVIWDENKRQEVFKEREVDFKSVVSAIENNEYTIREIEPDSKEKYGEERIRFIGEGTDQIYQGVYTIRNGNLRLITCWKAGRTERRKYYAERKKKEERKKTR